MKKQVAVNERGYRIGEEHHRAKFTEEEVEAVLYLRDEGLSYAQIAAKWDAGKTISKSTVRDICAGRIRSQFPDRLKPCG